MTTFLTFQMRGTSSELLAFVGTIGPADTIDADEA